MLFPSLLPIGIVLSITLSFLLGSLLREQVEEKIVACGTVVTIPAHRMSILKGPREIKAPKKIGPQNLGPHNLGLKRHHLLKSKMSTPIEQACTIV